MRGRARAALVAIALLGTTSVATAQTQATPAASPDEAVRSAAMTSPPVSFGKWQGTGFGGFLVPEHLDVSDDGGVDVLVHFNGAMMTDAEYRASKTNAVVMSIAISEVVGSAGYSRMFEDQSRLDRILDSLLAQVKKVTGTKTKLHLRRLGLVSWSAGMGAVGKLLRSAKWAPRIDTIVLLDSLHSGYLGKDGKAIKVRGGVAQPAMGLGEEAVDKRSLSAFAAFAREAAAGKKTFVLSASAIVPPGYASASETARALYMLASGKAVAPAELDGPRKMQLKFRGDSGNFHVFGWKGGGKHDHFDQLHLVGDILREHVGHRWLELARKERRDRTS